MKNKEMKVKAMSMAVAMSMVVGARQPSLRQQEVRLQRMELIQRRLM